MRYYIMALMVMAGGVGGAGAGQPAAGGPGAKEVVQRQGEPQPETQAEILKAYRELLAEGQPADGENAVPLIEKVAAELKAMTAEIMAAKFPGEDPLLVDFQALTQSDGEANAKAREVAEVVIHEVMAKGFGKQLAAIAQATRAQTAPDEWLLLNTLLPYLGASRHLTRFETGRMSVAIKNGNVAEWMTGAGEGLVLAKHVSRSGGMLISMLVAYAIDGLIFDQVEQLVNSGIADEGALQRVAALIDGVEVPGLERALRGEELLALDTLDYVYAVGPKGMDALHGGFEGKENAPKPRPEKRVIADDVEMGPGMPRRKEHLAILRECYAVIRSVEGMKTEQARAAAFAKVEELTAKSLLLGMMVPALRKPFEAKMYLEANREGARTLIALERYRLAKGAYPETLGELVPAYLAAAPMDPYTQKGLGYLPPSKGPHEGARAFVLYAAGLDEDDDGGKVNFVTPFKANMKSEGMYDGDLLLNKVGKHAAEKNAGGK